MSQIDKAKQAITKTSLRPMSKAVAEVRSHINLIQEAMKATMKKDVHYGVIPGTKKPTLYKPGAEVIMALFNLRCDPEAISLAEPGEIRYQVKARITAKDGSFVGSGIGECSSREEKYMWRSAVCPEEFDSLPDDQRRIKFRKNRYTGAVDQIQQVRVEPSDMANTILKMAKKRALIDAILTSTGASDLFEQDIEDLPEQYVESEVIRSDQKPTAPDPVEQVNHAQRAKEEIESPKSTNPALISDAQRKRLFAIAMGAGMTKEYFKDWLFFEWNLQSSKDIEKGQYDEICEKARAYEGGANAS